ncbi:tonB-system energizer ExbB [Cereibacter sphaeroides]|uniref:tonB-system energizer ExbB n=1 Tax=Cereibacter sphaeroides TaxID=1063 RepID=UPI001F20F43A|nr:tonB-system energizer ExbB [Cereibacter sphaeroides]MCE6952574.1 tonB-system energizer ExbB [Cereibacter sphaeroides]MCE6959956.1 tonB-system energizer ExbB [Cereibacter sphaeroides]MCE6968525.1 tonB-system energizer ExbB [Cereibacter sphaeroides]MCE6973041.1 tonB-system energizer ExbB [Cereibacter sphaeroides]
MALFLRPMLIVLLFACAAQAQEQPPAVPDLAPRMQAAPAEAPAAPSLPPAAAAPETPPAGATAAEAPGGSKAFGTAAAPVPVLPHELTPWGMFEAAHWVVQAVMILLAAASFLTWTVLLFKAVELALARRRLGRSAGAIRQAATLDEAAGQLAGRSDPAAFMARAALEEMRRSDAALDGAGTSGLKERVRSILERVEAQGSERLRRGIGLLATIGSTAPFVGLFGTVWGIMNAFIGISQSQTTNLAVVAPGIAEALLATAMGLVAAIPAVVIYNHFVRSIAAWRLRLGDAGAAVERMLSRDLDFRAARRG